MSLEIHEREREGVTILDINLDRLRYLDDVMPRNVTTLYSDRHNVLDSLARTDLLVYGPIELDRLKHKVRVAGKGIDLTPKEFLLLTHLARAGGEVVSRKEIAENVWDIGFNTDTNVVDVVVRRLRAKVDDPFKKKLVQTIRGVGYALKPS